MLDDETELPPIGRIGPDDHGRVCAYLGGLAREAADGRGDWVEIADSNLTIFTYGSDPAPDVDQIVVMDITNAIMATTEMQLRDNPRPSVEPVERGEPPESYWAGPQDVGLRAFGLMPQQVAAWTDPDTGETKPPLPIEEQQADAIREAVAMGGVPVGPPGVAPGPDGVPVQTPPPMQKLKAAWLVDVTDQVVADVYQQLLDVYWRRSNLDRKVRSNLNWTNVFGWTLWLYEFDADRQRFLITQTSVREMYIDPTVEDISDAQYAGAEIVVDAGRALRMCPAFSEQIRAAAFTGYPTAPDTITQRGDANDRKFERPVVSMRVMWLRDQPCPYEPARAVEEGLVESGDGSDTAAGPAGDVSGDDVRAVEGVGGGDDRIPEEAGEGEGAIPPGLEAAPPAYVLAETGQPVTPDSPDWPTYPCVRQMTVIEDVVVDDRPCEFADIPVLHNVNRPLPQRPFGVGEPYLLSRMQNAKSRVIRAMVENAEFSRAPMTAISESMARAMDDGGEAIGVFPGKVYKIDDATWQQHQGRMMEVIAPNPMPPALSELLPTLTQEINSGTGYTKVLQGEAQAEVTSGVQQAQLIQQATGLVGFKSQRTQDFLERLGTLCLHSLVRLDVKAVRKIVSKYPPHVLQAIIDRARAAEWDVKVTIASGNGTVQQAEAAAAAVDFDRGILSAETYCEKAGHDFRQERERRKAEAMEMATTMAPQGSPGQGQQQQGKKPAQG